VDERRKKAIVRLGVAALLVSLLIAAACILFVVLGGLSLFVSASRAPSWESQILDRSPLADAED
jgi:hypothetical protein